MAISINIKSLWSLNGLVKIIELVIGFVCIGLLRDYTLTFGDVDRDYVGIIAIGYAILSVIVLLISYVFLQSEALSAEVIVCIVAAIMNITGGALAIEAYEYGDANKDKAGTAMGSLMVINGIIFLIDAARMCFFINK